MFDGNHRSRREVNLSGKRKKPKDKKSLLEQSRLQRAQRQHIAQRNAAATCLQKRFRGNQVRKSLLLEQHNNNIGLNGWLGIVQRTRCTDPRKVIERLIEYAQVLRTQPTTTRGSARHIIKSVLEYLEDLSLDDIKTILTHHVVEDHNNKPLGSTLFGIMGERVCDTSHRPNVQQFLYHCMRHTTNTTKDTTLLLALLSMVVGGEETTTALAPLVQGLRHPQQQSSVQHILSRHAVTILNAAVHQVQKEPTSLAAPFVVLMKRILFSNVPILWGMNRMVKGESSMAAEKMEDTTPVDPMDSDDDDDDDGQTMSSKKPTPSTHQAKREELRTVQKLDRLNNANIAAMDAWYHQQQPQSPVVLSQDLADPSLWLVLGNTLLASGKEHSIFEYIMVLGAIFQGTVGLEPRQNASRSLVLNKLAFSPDFCTQLWHFLLPRLEQPYSTELLVGVSVFCDVFSHVNIALRDDQFLSQHTGTTTNNNTTASVQAQDIIQHLNPLLFDLYWRHAVVASQLQLWGCTHALFHPSTHEAVRARLLLSATKLWNSLYNRWARLVRSSPFCEESVWWFPPLSTLSLESAVTPRNGNDNSTMDDDDDDEAMDWEETKEGHDDESSVLADAFRDPKMARVLTSLPQVVPFNRRVKLFHSLLQAEKMLLQDDHMEAQLRMMAMLRGEDSGRTMIRIRRDQLFDDSMKELNEMGSKLKRRVQVTFVNQHGTEEAGIDGGGVFKEFIDDVIRDAFSTNASSTASHRFFSITPLQTLAVNPDLTRNYDLFPHYEFLGRVLGKAVFESILVEPQFCLPFLNQFLGKSNTIEDLKNLDLEYYRNLTKLLSLGDDEVNKLGLTFETTVGTGSFARSVELCRNGRNMIVSKQNVIQYIHLLSHHKLNVESSLQTKAFLKGFRDLIPASWVRLFSAYELQKLISGDDSITGIDVTALKNAMQYGGGYHPSQPIVQWFWEVVEEMSPDQQNKFLKFMTSCSRQPLLGFESLEPAPCIQQIRLNEAIYASGDASKRAPLPTSSTCMNLFKLPNYRSKELMKTKILSAIESGAGFELT